MTQGVWAWPRTRSTACAATPAPTEPALFLQAALYRRQDRLDDAVRVYRELLHLAPHNVEAPYDLAYVLIQQGRGDEVDDLIGLVARTEPRRASLLITDCP